MLYVLNKTNTTIHDPFFYFKIYYVKKIKSTSNENVD